MAWKQEADSLTCEDGGFRARIVPHPFVLEIAHEGAVRVKTTSGDQYPDAPLAASTGATWRALQGVPKAAVAADVVTLKWPHSAKLTLSRLQGGCLEFALEDAAADGIALGLASQPDEHYYGLGERFNKLDQRGELVELWVKNRASGGDTYKPIPFVASSLGYGLALFSSRRIHCALAHPMLPSVASFTVHAPKLTGTIVVGDTPAEVLERYTALVGRPPIPPSWVFLPWKSRDWRRENQETALEDIRRQQEVGLPCGVKLIDASWESEEHSFTFDPAKYADPAELIEQARAAGVEIVLWISPSLTAGTRSHREAAEHGFLIRDSEGKPYLHRLGNEPGWEGTTIDFTHAQAVAWYQENLRVLLELGVRGFKTDFGEQVPEDAVFADGRTGADLHNLLPVLYNQATWEIVREYDGILLARSAWAGSQRFPAVWAGDQSADFSPWAGLPTVIVAGQSAGWSGFPYWGSDVAGYFGSPDDECFARWTQFAALTPIMELHGLGVREPWLFAPSTLEIYRRYSTLHARLIPYVLMAASEAERTGLPLMRAMALAYPRDPTVHEDWVQYQYLYGPDLLVAPVYSWGASRRLYFPEGAWIDFFTGREIAGPRAADVPAPLDTLPLFVRSGVILPLLKDPWTPLEAALALRAFPLDGETRECVLPDGTVIALESRSESARIEVAGPEREYILEIPFHRIARVSSADGELARDNGTVRWKGNAVLTLELST